MLQVNPAFTSITGWQPGTIVGGHLRRVLADVTLAVEDAARTRTDGRAGPGFRGQFSIRRADGTESPSLVSVSAVLGPIGEVTGYVAVMTDISDRVRAEQALAESEQRYRLLAMNATTGTAWWRSATRTSKGWGHSTRMKLGTPSTGEWRSPEFRRSPSHRSGS